MSDLKPLERIEFYLDAIAEKLGGNEVEVPEPQTREEYFLKKIVDNASSGGGGGGDIDLLHTTVSIVNEDVNAYEPNLTLIGYAVKLSDLNENYEDVLYCTSIDGPYGVDLSTLSVSVPRNSTLTFNAYYLNSSTSEYMGGIMGEDILNATVTNMTYDEGWAIEDTTQNSTLSYVITKK